MVPCGCISGPVVPMTTSPPAQSGCRQPALLNGNTLIVGSSGVGIEVGTIAYFLCDPGYKIDPASQVRQTCSESGTWTPVAVQQCIGKKQELPVLSMTASNVFDMEG